jgi:predicted nuclease of predicted toxin-antitoxin system
MKLLVDMNLSPRWIAFLRDAGWEATHCSTVGKAEASDSEIMTYAAVNNYVVLTNDLDFAAILAASRQKKPSVAQIRAQDLSPIVIGSQIVAALRHVQAELEAGALLTIESDRTRLRVLPFQSEP